MSAPRNPLSGGGDDRVGTVSHVVAPKRSPAPAQICTGDQGCGGADRRLNSFGAKPSESGNRWIVDFKC
ncbi:MAG: hypothetical protein M0000_08495, partial [Actinomycetota bacterium]|nr:hypothetical protein [Actinomycetota bacterium]